MQRQTVLKTVILINLLFIPALVSAQTWGLNLGFNSSGFGGDDSEDVKNKSGFLVGALAILPMSNGLSIHFEANFTTKGASIEDVQYYDDKLEWLFNYIEVPALLQYKVNTSGSIAPFFYAGPAIALKLNAKMKYSAGSDSDTESVDDVKSIDFGLIFGGGINFAKQYYLSVRYTRGMTTWFDGTGLDLTNKVISFVGSITL